MQAIVQDTYGSVDVLRSQDIDVPQIADDEVLVRVRAASIHVGDWILMTGSPFVMRFATGLRKPKNRVPGTDFAGTVEAVGVNVTRFRPGDDVFGWGAGAFAEFARASEDQLLGKPADLSFEQAAADRRLRLDRPPAPSRRWRGPARPEGPDQRGIRRRRHVRRPDREGPRRRGHGRDQHQERRDGPLDRRRPRHRLHAGRLHRRRRAVRPHPRQRRQPLDGTHPARTDP